MRKNSKFKFQPKADQRSVAEALERKRPLADKYQDLTFRFYFFLSYGYLSLHHI